MKKKSNNSFDKMVEAFKKEFVKVENIELLQTDAQANSIFKTLTYRIAEINAYKNLVIHQFIPAVNKSVAALRDDVRRSIYREFLPAQEIDFEETIQDLLRSSYVSLFHKFENYLTDLLEVTDSLFNYSGESQESVAVWAKRKLGFDIKHVRQFPVIHKINYISNCVKHKDGFPLLKNPPIEYEIVDRKARIRLSAKEFQKDCEELIAMYLTYMRTSFLLRSYQYTDLMFADPERIVLSKDDEIIKETNLDNLKQMVTIYIESIIKI